MTADDRIAASAETAQRLSKLLRWYPPRWRAQHGDVLLHTLLEAAESAGRDRPTLGERRSAITHGLAARLDARFALIVASVALGLSLLGSFASMFGYFGRTDVALSLVVTAGLGPALSFVAVAALARHAGILSDGRALLLVGVAVAANGLGAASAISWALGFDAADAGRPVVGLAAAWGPLVSAALLLAVTGLALFLDAVFVRIGFNRIGSAILGILLGVIVAPLLGYALLTPASTSLLSLAVVVLAIHRRERQAAVSVRTPAPRPSPATSGVVAEVRVLSVFAFLAGAIGITWALGGSAFGADATEAMRVGIAVLCVATLPLLVALTRQLDSGSNRSRYNTWGPASFAIAGFAVLATDYVVQSGSGEITVGMWISTCLIAIAVAWFITVRLRLTRVAAMSIGVAAGATYAFTFGLFTTGLLVFLVPIFAVVLFSRAGRQRAAVKAEADPIPV